MTGRTQDQVATEAGAPVEYVVRAVTAGILTLAPDGTYSADAHAVVRTVYALHSAGFEPELVGEAISDGILSLDFLDEFSVRQAVASGRTYGELVADRSERAHLLGAVYAAMGLPAPDASTAISPEEEALISGFLDILTALNPEPDAPARAARIVGEGMRRIVESFLDLWDELARANRPTGGPATVSAPGGELSLRMAALLPSLLAWLERRHAETAVQARIIRSFEDGLEAAGRLPRLPRQNPAVAFVDLTGFTRLTEESGDELAVRTAVHLEELARARSALHAGRVVKLLGDGVVMRFPDVASGAAALARLLPEIAAAGLPAGHAGLSSGPVIDRDGDVFGRTVNLAARLATAAGPGEILVAADVVEALEGSLPAGLSFSPAGNAQLKGFSEPVATYRLLH